MKRKLISSIVFIMFICLSPQLAFAESLEDKTIGELLGRIEVSAGRILNDAENTGNALLANAADKLIITVRSLSYMLDDQRTKLFQEVDPRIQQVLQEMNNVEETLNNASNTIASVAELSSIDISKQLNKIPLTKKVDFYVSSIDGLLVTNNDVKNELRIRGLGFGYNTDSHKKSYVRLTIGNTEIPEESFIRPNDSELLIKYDKSVLANLFDENKIKYIPVKFDTTIEKDKRVLGIYVGKEEKEYNVKFNMRLFPKRAARFSGNEILTDKVLDGITKRKGVNITCAGASTKHPFVWRDTIRLAENEKALSVDYACTGSQCGWSYNWRGGGHSPDYDILDDGRVVNVFRKYDGENAITLYYYVNYQTFIDKHTEKVISPFEIEFDKPFEILLDPKNTSGTFKLEGTLATGQTIEIDNTMTKSTNGLLVRKSFSKFGDRWKGIFVLNRP